MSAGQMSAGQMSAGQISVGQMSVSLLSVCQKSVRPVGQTSVAKMFASQTTTHTNKHTLFCIKSIHTTRYHATFRR